MKLIKIFGLAAIAAAAVMAFVGVTSASAVTELEKVVLCKSMVSYGESSTCPTSSDFVTGTVIHAKLVAGTEAVLNGGLFGKIKCTGSTTLGTTTELLAHGKIEALAFTGCKFGSTTCTNPTVSNLPYLILVLLNDGHTGYHSVVTGIAATPEVTVVCGALVNCTFKAPAAGVLFTNELEANGDILKVNQAVENNGGGFCPSSSQWEAQYLTQCLENGSEVGCWPRMES